MVSPILDMGQDRPPRLPPGLSVNDTVLTFAPHAECPCGWCRAAHALYVAGALRGQLYELVYGEEPLPW